MDIFSSSLPERDATGQTKMPAAQSPWQLPAFGTLGPDSDVEVSALSPVEHGDGDTRPPERKLRNLHWVALLAGALCALLVSAVRNLPAREGTNPSAAGRQRSSQFSISTSGLLEAQKPQKKAELLLARAVSRNDEAVAQIQAQADSWRGHIKWTSQLSDLTTVALNSNDYDLRASAIEVQLAAYGLAKQEFTVDRLIRQANTSEHATRIWALWSLGLLGNRVGLKPFVYSTS